MIIMKNKNNKIRYLCSTKFKIEDEKEKYNSIYQYLSVLVSGFPC